MIPTKRPDSQYPFTETRISSSSVLREFSRDTSSEELVWHRDREHRSVSVLEGRGWLLQLDGELPVRLLEGEEYLIPAESWHRVIMEKGAGSLSVMIENIDEKTLTERKRRKKKLPGKSDYYVGKKTRQTKSNRQMAYEIEKCSKDPRPKSCYDEWTADKTYKKKMGQKSESAESHLDSIIDEALDLIVEDILEEKLSKKTRETLKKKAEKANMPLGALTGVYRKGLAAWLTGHRQGVPQHGWAMGRVNSFIRGGKARKVDAAEWKKVQKHRKK